MRTEIKNFVIIGLVAVLSLAEPGFARQRQTTRRSQRVRMEQVQLAGPDGRVKLTILPNAERLTFTVALGETTVLDPSTIVMNVDGYDLSAGVVLDQVERYQINETYPWHGVHSTA
ncbi:MAG: glycoside hydrolase family 97 N-terminal domain-containing protein, partial [Sedimentisphaerales bacterium]|nr:glycoside hydrolase family 97 N-terminal domain-containing protein [Sedimentisphaerales bacterium]